MSRHYGFNFQWMFFWNGRPPQPPDERALDFMAGLGFDFVRIPADYRFWTRDGDYFNLDEAGLRVVDDYLAACRSRGLHMCLNMHRAPGYSVNQGAVERHNLWVDAEAQDGFVFQWQAFAARYRGVPSDYLSFNLVNEPLSIGQGGLTRENHAAVMRRAVATIRAVDPERQIVLDGLGYGNIAMPELADLAGAGVIHSTRGYLPMAISHHRAAWVNWNEHWPAPVYPGVRESCRVWDKDALREHYRPWREMEAQGVTIHVGEFGCYNKTPNDVALRWLGDLLSLYGEFGWGYALWEFAGAFGIVEHGRPGAVYEEMQGYRVDRALLDLLLLMRDA